jgi:hypothetical protein
MSTASSGVMYIAPRLDLFMQELKSIINETPRKLPRKTRETQALVFSSSLFL